MELLRTGRYEREETHWHWKLPDGDRERDPTCLELGLDRNDGRMAIIVEIGGK